MKVLILAAHPDDETLGCGGTIARLAAEGHEVNVGILATGLAARGQFTTEEYDAIKRQAAEAGKILGVRSVDLANFPDNRMDTVAILDVARHIEDLLERYQPEVVYTHCYYDLNQDHQVVNHATKIALRPFTGSTVKQLYVYEVPSSTELPIGGSFEPNVFSNIFGDCLERKIRAMQIYESEARVSPHPRSPGSLTALATVRGFQCGLLAAEAFQLVREIR